MKFCLLILKNLKRNPLRSILTALAVVVLVVIFSMIWTVVLFLDRAMEARAADVPVVMTERYRFPSRFDRRFLEDVVSSGTAVNTELREVKGFDANKFTLWHFVFVTLDPEMRDKDLQFGIISTYPDKIPHMIDEMEELDPNVIKLMENPPISRLANAGILVGKDRLEKLKRKVGDILEVRAVSHREGTGARQPIQMKLEIVGELPSKSRWAQGAFMDYRMLDRVLHEKQNDMDGKIMLGWLKFDSQESAAAGSAVIEKNISEVKSEIASTAVARFLEPYMNILRIVKYILTPLIAMVMILIVANAVIITVRERTNEMAVLKVLGFRPLHILILVLGEVMTVGVLAGLAGSLITYVLVNGVMGGIRVPFGFFPIYFVPAQVFLWGLVLGAFTTFLGGIIPAIRARNVKVSEVFARVT